MYSAPPTQQAPQVPRPQFQGGYAPPPPPAAPPPRTSGAALIVDQTNQRFDLRVGSNIIGRGSDSDLQLLDQGISRRHLDVQYDGHYATAYDLGSTNGTTVNGRRVTGSVVVREGDQVAFGRMAFRLAAT
jgi:pSer/pThr/pTyr-binding forkhead associated (FHA) protein